MNHIHNELSEIEFEGVGALDQLNELLSRHFQLLIDPFPPDLYSKLFSPLLKHLHLIYNPSSPTVQISCNTYSNIRIHTVVSIPETESMREPIQDDRRPVYELQLAGPTLLTSYFLLYDTVLPISIF